MKPFPPWVGQFEFGVRPTQLQWIDQSSGRTAHLIPVAEAHQKPSMRIELNGVPMQVIHGGEQQIVQSRVDGQVLKATPLAHRFVLIQVKHPRIQHLGVVQPAQLVRSMYTSSKSTTK